ncbi:MAG: extracellular solute-binding protein [Chloroflexi bacterium]|nr:extracellular solute-binding protein [Chloroflexota bacterium]
MQGNLQRLTRRRVLAGGAAGLGLALLAACAPAQPEAKPAEKPAEKPAAAPAQQAPAKSGATAVKFSVWGDVQDKDVYDNITDDFNKAQQKVSATPEQWVGNFYDKLKTVLAGGTPPDITYIQGWVWQPYAVKDVFVDLNPYKTKDNHTAPWPDQENYKYQTQFRGKLIMQPSDTGGMVMFYNKAQFDKMKVPYPTDEWTYDQFVDISKKLTTTTGERNYGYQINGGYIRNIPWIRWKGELEWDTIAEPKKALWDQPGIIEGIQFQQYDAINTLKISPSPVEMTGGANQLQTGNVAMKYEGPWFLPNMQGAKAKREGGTPFDVVLLPMGPNGKRLTHLAVIHGHCLIKAGKNQDAAWELMKWFSSDNGQKRIADGGRQPMNSAMTVKHWVETAKKNFNFKYAEAFAKSLEMGSIDIVGEIDDTFLWNEVHKAAWDAMQGGQKKASELIPDMNKAMQKILDDYWAKQK